MSWRIFTNKTGSSNKFWKFRYTEGGCSVEKEWGRIGGRVDSQTKAFGTTYAAERYAEGEIHKKLRKGYEEVLEENLEKETQVAQTIGTRWKINKIEFLSSEWSDLDTNVGISAEYHASRGVYVEMLNSWNKERCHLLINKSNAAQFRNGTISGGVVDLSSKMYIADTNFVLGVRKMLRMLYQAVEEVAVRFAAVGARVLSLDDDDLEQAEMVQAFQAVARTTGVSTQVIEKFAVMGNRALEL